jgi:hypothetical protein
LPGYVGQYNAEVVYWTGMAKRKKKIKKFFPKAIYHVMAKAILCIPADGLGHIEKLAKYPLDADVLRAMEAYQLTALKLMDRMDVDLRTFTFEERLRHYYMQLGYWYNVLKHIKPDLVFFPIAPHDNYDFIIYGLCRYLGIRTMMLDRTAIPCRVLWGERIEDCSERLGEQYQRVLAENAQRKIEDITLSPYVEQYYARMQGSQEQALPPNVRKKMEKRKLKSYASTEETISHYIRHEWLELRGQIRRRKGLRRPDSYLKQWGHTPAKSRCNYLDEVRFRLRAKRIKDAMRQYYLRFQSVPDLTKPYIFVALHYQPERNSVPLGEWFGDQYLMVDMLAKSLPPGWKLYVKEHGQQWSYFSKGERGRTKIFYEDIRKIRNVQLVPVETPSFQLIDHAQITATVAGSVGWESIMRGKPTMVFGNAWYQKCDGVWRIRRPEDIAEALESLRNGVKVDARKVKLFLHTLDNCAVHTVIDTLREDHGDVTETSMVDNFILTVGNYLVREFPDRVSQASGIEPSLAERPRIAMVCPTETVLQEYVALAEKFYTDARCETVLAVPSGFMDSAYLKGAKAPLNVIVLPKAQPIEIVRRAITKIMPLRRWARH